MSFTVTPGARTTPESALLTVKRPLDRRKGVPDCSVRMPPTDQPPIRPLTQLKLEAVVFRVRVVIDHIQIEARGVRVHLKEVHRVRTRGVVAETRTRVERAADHPAQVL